MLAAVQIAPLERWCATARSGIKRYPRIVNCCGMTVRIETSSMRQLQENCFGRAWSVTLEDSQRLLIIGDGPDYLRGSAHHAIVCEHVVEMD